MRKHGAKEFHVTSLEESDKAEYCLEKLRRVLNEVKCSPEQVATYEVSLLQGATYDWWKLVLRPDYLGFLRLKISSEVYHRCLQRGQVESIYESKITEPNSSRV